MTHNFPIATAKTPCRTVRVHLNASGLRGTAASFAFSSRALAPGAKTRGIDRETMRCRAFLAGGDP